MALTPDLSFCLPQTYLRVRTQTIKMQQQQLTAANICSSIHPAYEGYWLSRTLDWIHSFILLMQHLAMMQIWLDLRAVHPLASLCPLVARLFSFTKTDSESRVYNDLIWRESTWNIHATVFLCIPEEDEENTLLVTCTCCTMKLVLYFCPILVWGAVGSFCTVPGTRVGLHQLLNSGISNDHC